MIINKMVSIRINWGVPLSSVKDFKQDNLENEDEYKLPKHWTEDCPTHQLSRRHSLR